MKSPGNMAAVPAGDPVQITSPGKRVMDSVIISMISPRFIIIWLELESCLVSVTPSWVRWALIGRLSTSMELISVSIHGPSGAKVSIPFARAHCPSANCRSRDDTSLMMVKPNTTDFQSSALTFLHGFPITNASSPSNSTLVAKSGILMAAPGPTTAVGGLINRVGGRCSADF